MPRTLRISTIVSLVAAALMAIALQSRIVKATARTLPEGRMGRIDAAEAVSCTTSLGTEAEVTVLVSAAAPISLRYEGVPGSPTGNNRNHLQEARVRAPGHRPAHVRHVPIQRPSESSADAPAGRRRRDGQIQPRVVPDPEHPCQYGRHALSRKRHDQRRGKSAKRPDRDPTQLNAQRCGQRTIRWPPRNVNDSARAARTAGCRRCGSSAAPSACRSAPSR